MLTLEWLYRWWWPWPSDLPISISRVTDLHHHDSLYMILGTKSRTWSMLVKHPTDWATFSAWLCENWNARRTQNNPDHHLQGRKASKIPHTRCWNVIYLNTPKINSETPIRCSCHIKESNQSTSSWCHLTKMEPRFGFSASLSPFFHCPCVLLYESESLSAGWRLSCAFVPMSMFVLVCLSCLSLTKGFVLSFIEQHRMHHVRKIPSGGYFKETFNGVNFFF